MGSWSWIKLNRVLDSRVAVQSEELMCGPACAQMLLDDRGFSFSQEEIADGIELPSRGAELASRMNFLTDSNDWKGGGLFLPPSHLADVFKVLCGTGSWSALLLPDGPGHMGHWVVVDGFDRNHHILIRDPVGERYAMLESEFRAYWKHLIALFDQGE